MLQAPQHPAHAGNLANLVVTEGPAFFFQVTGLAVPFMLDMAPNAFDDQYESCVEDMEKKAPQLLQEDFNMNEELKLEWEKAEINWKEIKNSTSYPAGFHDFHGTALVAYTGNLAIDFNRAVRDFPWGPPHLGPMNSFAEWSCITSNDGDWKWATSSAGDGLVFSFVNPGPG